MAHRHSQATIDAIRATSRNLVRQLGFMGGDFAGTDLPPSAVHALIEIESRDMTARDLAATLRLEKSSVSRMLRKLVEAGDVQEETGLGDTRVKLLSLTPAGKSRVSAIHKFARGQVMTALDRLRPGQESTVLEGVRLYSDALALEETDRPTNDIQIQEGYLAGIIARITEMHASITPGLPVLGSTSRA